jgi:DNA-binding response OmpR family regulator
MPAANLQFRVLIVDDNQDAADTLAVVLRRIGLEVAVARDGIDALEQADRLKPDVVLLDVLLPKMNGLEVCRGMRQTEWGKRTAVIALTGLASRESDFVRIKEAGFDFCLLKPFGAEELLKTVQSALEARRAAERPA